MMREGERKENLSWRVAVLPVLEVKVRLLSGKGNMWHVTLIRYLRLMFFLEVRRKT